MMTKVMLFILLLYGLNGLIEKSDEFYECLNPDKIVKSASECTSIEINETEGYKCCSMKITYNKNSSYNCFAIEIEYTKNKSIFDEYIANNSIASIYEATGGQMEIECGDKLRVTQNYEKVSDEYMRCYKSHVNGVQEADECYKYVIPEKENSNCCFIENIKLINSKITTDKRCYIIQNDYLTNTNNLNNYLLDNSNVESLDEIKNSNITIKCKDYGTFYFTSEFDQITQQDKIDKDDGSNNSSMGRKKESGISKGVIVGVVVAGIIVLIGASYLVYYCINKSGKDKNANNPIKSVKNETFA